MAHWEQKAVEHPGRVREYVRRVYGDEAFKTDSYGRKIIRDGYLERAEMRASREGDESLVRALTLARTFKKQTKVKA